MNKKIMTIEEFKNQEIGESIYIVDITYIDNKMYHLVDSNGNLKLHMCKIKKINKKSLDIWVGDKNKTLRGYCDVFGDYEEFIENYMFTSVSSATTTINERLKNIKIQTV